MKKWLTKDRFRRIEVLTFLILVGHIVLLVSRSKAVTLPTTWQYITDNPLQQRTAFSYATFAEIPVVYAAAALLAVFCIMILAKMRVYRAAAKADDKAGISRYRWYEIGVGGAFLAVFAAHLAGAYNPAIAVSILAAGIIFGMAGSRVEVEKATKTPVPKQTTWTLILSGAIIWFLLGQQIVAGLLNSSTIPEYVYGIAGATLAYWVIQLVLVRLSRSAKSKSTITGTLLKHRVITLLVLAAVAWQVVFFVR